MDIKCTCGSSDLIETESEAGNYVVMKTAKGKGSFLAKPITAQPFVCRDCRLISFRVKEADMERLHHASGD